jgi:hypothetical protein
MTITAGRTCFPVGGFFVSFSPVKDMPFRLFPQKVQLPNRAK